MFLIKFGQFSNSRAVLKKAHSDGPEIVNHNEFWQFLEISWRFSLFSNLLITAALVVKLGIWAILGKIAIKSPKIVKIHFGQRILNGLNVLFSKLPDFLKLGQILVKRFLNISTGLVDYSPF